MPLTTVSLLRYPTLAARAYAFAQMGLAPARLSGVPGLKFGRLLGSGGGNGFSLRPNFGVYAWVAHWEDRGAAAAFFAHNDWWDESGRRRSETLTCWLQPTMSHGQWGGQNPFAGDADPNAHDPDGPVAVITRATIRTRKLPDFWRYVPRTSASVYDHPERLLSIGLGEYPVFMQATFSLWSSGRAMRQFAYRSDHHAKVVRLTRERDWYREESFTRFGVLDIDGTWGGSLLKARR